MVIPSANFEHPSTKTILWHVFGRQISCRSDLTLWNLATLVFRRFGLKMPIRASLWRFRKDLTSFIGSNINVPRKDTSFHGNMLCAALIDLISYTVTVPGIRFLGQIVSDEFDEFARSSVRPVSGHRNEVAQAWRGFERARCRELQTVDQRVHWSMVDRYKLSRHRIVDVCPPDMCPLHI